MYGYPQPHVQPKVNDKIVLARKEWKPKTPNVSSSVTSSASIGVTPILTKSYNCAESVNGAYKPHSMSRLYVEPLKIPNDEENVKSYGKGSVVAAKGVVVTPFETIFDPLSVTSKTVVVGPLKETLSKPDVVSDVTTSSTQPDQIVSESESAYEKNGSENGDQSVWSLLLSLSEFIAKKGEN